MFDLGCLLLTGDQDTRAGLTSKQRKLLVKCKLQLRLLDLAFLEAAGQDKKPALVRALEVITQARPSWQHVMTVCKPPLSKCQLALLLVQIVSLGSLVPGKHLHR